MPRPGLGAGALVAQPAPFVIRHSPRTTGMPADVAKLSKIENPPSGIEEVPAQISRLLEAHETIINETNAAVELTEQHKDWGTNDLLMSDVLRTNQLQVWFISQHLVDAPVVRAD